MDQIKDTRRLWEAWFTARVFLRVMLLLWKLHFVSYNPRRGSGIPQEGVRWLRRFSGRMFIGFVYQLIVENRVQILMWISSDSEFSWCWVLMFLIPRFDGAICSLEQKEALWGRGILVYLICPCDMIFWFTIARWHQSLQLIQSPPYPPFSVTVLSHRMVRWRMISSVDEHWTTL